MGTTCRYYGSGWRKLALFMLRMFRADALPLLPGIAIQAYARPVLGYRIEGVRCKATHLTISPVANGRTIS
jgi:hypothetical protein